MKPAKSMLMECQNSGPMAGQQVKSLIIHPRLWDFLALVHVTGLQDIFSHQIFLLFFTFLFLGVWGCGVVPRLVFSLFFVTSYNGGCNFVGYFRSYIPSKRNLHLQESFTKVTRAFQFPSSTKRDTPKSKAGPKFPHS